MQFPPHPDAPINPITIGLEPHLAVFDILDRTLTVAIYTLIATYPALADPECPSPPLDGEADASKLMAQLYACQLANAQHRRSVLKQRLDRCRLGDPYNNSDF